MALHRKMGVLALLLVVGSAFAQDPEPEPVDPAAEPDAEPDAEPAAEPAAAPASDDLTNVAGDILHTITHELHHVQFPWLLAVLSAIVGVMLVFKGKDVFKYAVVLMMGCAIGLLAKSSVHAFWTHNQTPSIFHHQQYCEDFVGFVVFIITSLGAWYGYHGVLVCGGACLGFLLAWELDVVFVNSFEIGFMAKTEVQSVWFAVWVGLGTWFFLKERHNWIVAMVAPAIGGAFFSSAFWYAVTELFLKFGCKGDDGCPGGLTPKKGQWVDFFNLLFAGRVSKEEDFGLFHGSSYNFTLGSDDPYHMDSIVGIALWVILFLIGWKVQTKALKKEKNAASKGRAASETETNEKPKPVAAPKATAKAREPLEEALLQTV